MANVQVILDEAAAIGPLDSIADALNLGRGYGIRFLFIYQSVGQLKKCWPEGQDQTLLSNVTQVFFGVNDYETAEYASKRLGNETILVDSGGTSSGGSEQSSLGAGGLSQSYSASWNGNRNWSQAARELLRPEEVLALDERVAITFVPGGVPPIWTKLIRYYEGMPRPARWWHRARLFTGSCFYFFAALLVAAALTAAVANRVNPSLPSNYWQVR